MTRHAIWILIVFGILAADPASAWFWDKKKVKDPAIAAEVQDVSKSAVREEAKPVKKKGLWLSIKKTGRDIGGFFKGIGKDAKESDKDVPGEAKKGGKAVGKGFKDAGRTIGTESKKGAKVVGQGFKQFGKDIKDSTRKVFVGEQAESAD
jgi:hypothetical protein